MFSALGKWDFGQVYEDLEVLKLLTFLRYLVKYSQKVAIVTAALESSNFKANLSFLPSCHLWVVLRKCKRKQLVCIKLRSF